MAKKKKGGNKNEWKITDIFTILLLLIVGYLFILMFSIEEENKGISLPRWKQQEHILPTQVETRGEEVNVGIKLPSWLQQRNTLPKWVNPRAEYNA